MSTNKITTIDSPSAFNLDLSKIPDINKLGSDMSTFLDYLSATSRSTFYTDIKDIETEIMKSHKSIFDVDRGIYSIPLLLSATTDYGKARGIFVLLANPRLERQSLISIGTENKIIQVLLNQITVPRMLRLFLELRKGKINNRRTSNLIIRNLIINPSTQTMELWAVKYRTKMKLAIEHAIGKRRTSMLKKILAKSVLTLKEMIMVTTFTHLKHVQGVGRTQEDILSFVLGNEKGWNEKRNDSGLELIKAYIQAKLDFEKGKGLPYEVLEGIRSTYHPEIDHKRVLEMSRDALTATQSMTMQRKAKAEGVEVKFNPETMNAVKLYVYLYERYGELDTEEKTKLQNVLYSKAQKAADALPVSWDNVGILVDNSKSMTGHKTQSMRPMAIAMATKDMLKCSANKVNFVVYSNPNGATKRMVYPRGETSLAKKFVGLFNNDLDVAFIISDGYENSPSGRLAETIKCMRNIGIDTPIYHLNPVVSAESKSGGLRGFGDDVQSLPVVDPKDMGLAMVKIMLKNDAKKGIEGILGMGIKALSRSNRRSK